MQKYILPIILIFSYSAIKAQQPLKSSQYVNYMGSANLNIKDYTTIYTVPKDSSLVITDIIIDGYYSTSTLFRNKKKTITLDKKTWFHTCTGLIFMAGDELKLYNEGSVDFSSSWNIIGYLKKQD